MIKYSNMLRRLFALCVTLLFGVASLSAQLLPERGLVREGNEQFRRRNFYNSLNRYNEALEHAPGSYEALYNRANAYMHLMFENPQDSTLRREVSNKYFEDIINNQYLAPEQRAEVLRNIGESLFLQQEYEAALNAFRESLKLNADDAETKRNYVLTKRIVDQKRHAQQQQQQQQDKQDNQNNNDNNDNQNDQNSDGQNEGDDKRDSNDNKKDNQNDQNNDGQNEEGDKPEEQNEPQDESRDKGNDDNQPKPEGISDEQERMLDAIQAEENKTQDKMKEGKQGVVMHGKKNW